MDNNEKDSNEKKEIKKPIVSSKKLSNEQSEQNINMSFTNLDSEKDKINEVLTNNELTQINLNLYNVIKSVCKIIIKDGKIGTGFFIKLYKNNKEFFCIMTNEHIITQELDKFK